MEKINYHPPSKKVGQDTEYANYRPVNNLPFLSKITEKAMIQQLNTYLETHCPLPNTVCAYRKNLSTEHAILKLLDTIYKNMDKQCVTLVLAIDLSAAFDTVNHSLLLKVLNKTYNIKGTALKWFTSYLSDHSVCVQINNRVSQELDLPFSVPQGSCAGPILFNIYISTLTSYLSLSNCDILGYADDNTISTCIDPNVKNNEQQIVDKIQNSIEKTKHWMCLNRLKMNDQKTNFIMYGNNVQLAKCSTKHIKVGEETIVSSDKINLLGIDIDKNLTFKEHIKKKCKIAMYNLYNIRSLRQHLNNKTTQTLIYGLVTSHLDYINAIYSTLPASTTKPLNRIQNLAAKLVLNSRDKDISSSMAKQALHWLPIRERSIYKCLTILHPCVHGMGPGIISNLIKTKSSRRLLRSNSLEYMLDIPRTNRVTYGDRAFSIHASKLWNKLPRELKNIKDKKKFKKKLKTHLYKLAYG